MKYAAALTLLLAGCSLVHVDCHQCSALPASDGSSTFAADLGRGLIEALTEQLRAPPPATVIVELPRLPVYEPTRRTEP